MRAEPAVVSGELESRARQSQGTSAAAIYRRVAEVIRGKHQGGGLLLDVGCGTGNLWSYLRGQFERYAGADAVHYDGFPSDATFFSLDLDGQRLHLADNTAEMVAAVETIEHLENPRAFMRELVRVAKPGGWLVVTTPNQLSLLSKMTLMLKNQFNAFQENSYPAHLTALLEVDLRRIAEECNLCDIDIFYSQQGRVPGFPWHFPGFLSRWFARAFSDNVLLLARKPRA